MEEGKKLARLGVHKRRMSLLAALVISLGILLLIDHHEALTLENPAIGSYLYRLMAAPSPVLPDMTSPDSAEERQVPTHWKDDSFDDIIEETARRYDIEPALVKAIIMAESGYDPTAVSKQGARGLMQLMPRTAAALGVEDSFDPEENIDAGVRYFRHLMDQYDEETTLALAAYNAGSRRVREHQGVPPYPATQIYIEKVFQYYRHYQRLSAGKVERV